MSKKSVKKDELGNPIRSKKLVKVKWNGEAPTLIRKQEGGEKFPIKKGETIQVEEGVAEAVNSAYPELEIVGAGIKDQAAQKEMKVEGKLKKKIAKG